MPHRTSSPSLLRRIGTLSRRVRTRFDARAGEFGLTQARAFILLHLDEKQRMTQAELAEELAVERPTMARLVDAMEVSGLVCRETSAEDRRYRYITLTEQAQTEVQALRELTEALRRDVLDGISDEDLRVAERVIDRMLENISRADS